MIGFALSEPFMNRFSPYAQAIDANALFQSHDVVHHFCRVCPQLCIVKNFAPLRAARCGRVETQLSQARGPKAQVAGPPEEIDCKSGNTWSL